MFNVKEKYVCSDSHCRYNTHKVNDSFCPTCHRRYQEWKEWKEEENWRRLEKKKNIEKEWRRLEEEAREWEKREWEKKEWSRLEAEAKEREEWEEWLARYHQWHGKGEQQSREQQSGGEGNNLEEKWSRLEAEAKEREARETWKTQQEAYERSKVVEEDRGMEDFRLTLEEIKKRVYDEIVELYSPSYEKTQRALEETAQEFEDLKDKSLDEVFEVMSKSVQGRRGMVSLVTHLDDRVAWEALGRVADEYGVEFWEKKAAAGVAEEILALKQESEDRLRDLQLGATVAEDEYSELEDQYSDLEDSQRMLGEELDRLRANYDALAISHASVRSDQAATKSALFRIAQKFEGSYDYSSPAEVADRILSVLKNRDLKKDSSDLVEAQAQAARATEAVIERERMLGVMGEKLRTKTSRAEQDIAILKKRYESMHTRYEDAINALHRVARRLGLPILRDSTGAILADNICEKFQSQVSLEKKLERAKAQNKDLRGSISCLRDQYWGLNKEMEQQKTAEMGYQKVLESLQEIAEKLELPLGDAPTKNLSTRICEEIEIMNIAMEEMERKVNNLKQEKRGIEKRLKKKLQKAELEISERDIELSEIQQKKHDLEKQLGEVVQRKEVPSAPLADYPPVTERTLTFEAVRLMLKAAREGYSLHRDCGGESYKAICSGCQKHLTAADVFSPRSLANNSLAVTEFLLQKYHESETTLASLQKIVEPPSSVIDLCLKQVREAHGKEGFDSEEVLKSLIRNLKVTDHVLDPETIYRLPEVSSQAADEALRDLASLGLLATQFSFRTDFGEYPLEDAEGWQVYYRKEFRDPRDGLTYSGKGALARLSKTYMLTDKLRRAIKEYRKK